MTPQLYIMVKEPRPGRVKTRLGRDIGMIPATWWFRHQTRRLIRRLSADPRWQTVLAVSPDHAGVQSRVWPSHLPRFAQGGGNLGDRMGRALRSPVPGPVLVVGADIPGITPRHIADAFKALGDHDAVLGPAPDGGYWLVGLKNARPAPRDLFKGVRWSSEHARADTLETLGGLSCAMVAELRDVDRASDLATVTAP
ncbi:MAG: glycosyltransferase [Rhodobacteraceae bacterium]|nr:glycosyltransferase [Paracoccaceae bacterium]